MRTLLWHLESSDPIHVCIRTPPHSQCSFYSTVSQIPDDVVSRLCMVNKHAPQNSMKIRPCLSRCVSVWLRLTPSPTIYKQGGGRSHGGAGCSVTNSGFILCAPRGRYHEVCLVVCPAFFPLLRYPCAVCRISCVSKRACWSNHALVIQTIQTFCILLDGCL